MSTLDRRCFMASVASACLAGATLPGCAAVPTEQLERVSQVTVTGGGAIGPSYEMSISAGQVRVGSMRWQPVASCASLALFDADGQFLATARRASSHSDSGSIDVFDSDGKKIGHIYQDTPNPETTLPGPTGTCLSRLRKNHPESAHISLF
jgi:hypothetical protein